MGAVGRGDVDRWGYTECHLGERKPGNYHSHNFWVYLQQPCIIVNNLMDLMSHVSSAFIGFLNNDDLENGYLPLRSMEFCCNQN